MWGRRCGGRSVVASGRGVCEDVWKMERRQTEVRHVGLDVRSAMLVVAQRSVPGNGMSVVSNLLTDVKIPRADEAGRRGELGACI